MQPQPPPVQRGGAADALDRGAVGIRVVGAMQQFQPRIDVGRRVPVPDGVAFLQQRGEVGGQRLLPLIRRGQQHARQPRMRAHPRHAAAHRGDPPFRVQRIQFPQQRAAGGQRAGGRRIEEGEIPRRRPPGREIEREARQLGLQDLRPVGLGQAAMQRLRP